MNTKQRMICIPVDVDLQGFRVPVAPKKIATFYLPEAMSQRDWDLMVATLNVMKPGLVMEPAADDEEVRVLDMLKSVSI